MQDCRIDEIKFASILNVNLGNNVRLDKKFTFLLSASKYKTSKYSKTELMYLSNFLVGFRGSVNLVLIRVRILLLFN